MDSYIIQVQPQDELTVLIDKLMHTQAERIYLLVPEDSRIAQNVLNFRLLKREADSLSKEIIVASASPRVQNLALKAHLQAHQETNELKESASLAREEVPIRRPKLSDVMIPPSPVTDVTSKETVIETVKRKRPIKEDKKTEQITDFLKKKPKIKTPEFQQKHVPVLPKIRINPAAAGLVLGEWRARLNTTIVFRAILFSLLAISIGVGATTFYFVLPKSKIYIKPKVDKIAVDLTITGNINTAVARADGASGKISIPAQIFEKSLESSRMGKATGEKEVRDKATGLIRVYNSFSSSPQTLVKTTRFISENGKLFRTIETIVVPGAEVESGKIVPSSAIVEVIAAEAGSEYNLGPSTFSIPGFKGTPKYLAFYGESENSMSGGEIGKVKVITDTDFKGLEDGVREELSKGIVQSLDELLPEGFFVPAGAKSTKDIELSSSAKAGDRTSELTISGKISTEAFAVRKSDIDLILADYFVTNFPEKRPIKEGREISYEAGKVSFSSGTVEIKVSLSQNAAAIIDNQGIIDGVLGKGEDGVRQFLAGYPGVEEARVTFWPFWVSKIPSDAGKIEVIVE